MAIIILNICPHHIEEYNSTIRIPRKKFINHKNKNIDMYQVHCTSFFSLLKSKENKYDKKNGTMIRNKN